jgi:hypothetical protein
MRRGRRWQVETDTLYARLMALGDEMRERAARGDDFADLRALWWLLMARYNALHGAGSPRRDAARLPGLRRARLRGGRVLRLRVGRERDRQHGVRAMPHLPGRGDRLAWLTPP